MATQAHMVTANAVPATAHPAVRAGADPDGFTAPLTAPPAASAHHADVPCCGRPPDQAREET